MTNKQRQEAIEYIMGQLENGYVDLCSYDQDALEIIKEATNMIKIIDEWNSIPEEYLIMSDVLTTKEENSINNFRGKRAEMGIYDDAMEANIKCYILYERSGEYEDAYKHIVFASLDRDKVEAEKKAFEAHEKWKTEQAEKCMQCPSEEMTKRKLKKRRHEVEVYCDEFEPEFDGNECWCKNANFFNDECTYYIEEVRLD